MRLKAVAFSETPPGSIVPLNVETASVMVEHVCRLAMGIDIAELRINRLNDAVDPARYAAVYAELVGDLINLFDLKLAMLGFHEFAAGQAHARAAGVPVMLSHHDLGDAPGTERMLTILEDAARHGPDICKLAVMPKDAGDVVRLIDATWRMRQRHPNRLLLTMAMGGIGAVWRAQGQVFGLALTFASPGGAGSAPGQIYAARLTQVIDTLGRALETAR